MADERGGDARRRWEAADPGFLRLVLDQLEAGLVLTDLSGRITAVNARSEQLLGRTSSAMVGRDAHELLHRGPGGEPIPRSGCAAQGVSEHGRPVRVESDTFLHGDGHLLPVSWSGAPLVEGGRTLGVAVLFSDVSESRADLVRQTAHLAAVEDLAARLALVGEITAVLSQTLDVEEALRRLVRLVVPRLADWATVDLRTSGDSARRVVVAGPEGREIDQAWLGPLPPVAEGSRSALARVLRGGDAVLLGPAEIAAVPDTPLAQTQAAFLRATGATSAVVAPLGTARQVAGALTLVRTGTARPYDATELALAADVGRRAGLAVDNARLYGQQRDIAATMQRHLLTALPQLGHLRMAARYQPAPAGSQVGGDWYDAFLLRDGSTALAIGDVVGHDLTAAAGMAQLRSMLRSLAWDRGEPPAAIVDRMDDALAALTDVPMATLVLACVEGPEQGPWQLTYTSAGHPPPLLVTADGRARYLEEGQNLLLGGGQVAGASPARRDAVEPLPPGSTLLLYTDGLVEVPGGDLTTGLNRLRRHAAALARRPLDDFLDRILERMPPGGTDDIALLALRLPWDEGPDTAGGPGQS